MGRVCVYALQWTGESTAEMGSRRQSRSRKLMNEISSMIMPQSQKKKNLLCVLLKLFQFLLTLINRINDLS